jgi:dolichol-phosphate mannosyltransferase
MMQTTPSQALVIVPTYNERENLPGLVEALLAVTPAVDVLVVDDNSPDGTGDVADALHDLTGRVHVIHRAGKQGLGTAYLEGFRFALRHDYDFIVEMDADGSHRPEDLPRLLTAAQHADVVIGSRNVSGGRVVGWSPLRHLISAAGSLYARSVLRLPIRDCTAGFKAFRRTALAALDLSSLRSSGYAFQVEVNYACVRAGLQLAEVPVVFPDRTVGKSKMSARIALEAVVMVLRLRLNAWRAWSHQSRTVPDAGALQIASLRSA